MSAQKELGVALTVNIPRRDPTPLALSPSLLRAAISPREALQPTADTYQDEHTGSDSDKAKGQLLGLEHLLDTVHGERDVDLDLLNLDEESADERAGHRGANW